MSNPDLLLCIPDNEFVLLAPKSCKNVPFLQGNVGKRRSHNYLLDLRDPESGSSDMVMAMTISQLRSLVLELQRGSGFKGKVVNINP